MLTGRLHAKLRAILAPAGSGDHEATHILAAVTGRNIGQIELDRLLGRDVPEAQARLAQVYAARRVRREPLQHILGTAPFMRFNLAVGPGVFVPRPETEGLVEHAVALLAGCPGGVVVDVGAGSGAIAIALAHALPQLEVVALEASPAAWPWLLRNVRAHAPRVHARFGDWAAQLARVTGPLCGIVSNPPYVPAAELPRHADVHLFDPARALYAGRDGLDEIRRLAAAAADRLAPAGILAVEHTEAQGGPVRALFTDHGLAYARTRADLSGRPRYTLAQQPPSGSPQ